MSVYAPRRGPAWWERIVDRFRGPRDWSVVRDEGERVVYVRTYMVLRSDTILAARLRGREAVAYARRNR